MSLTGKRCECGNAASYGLPTDRKRLWCGPCGKKHGAVLLQQQKMCEECGLKCAGFGLLAEKKRRWSAPIPAPLFDPSVFRLSRLDFQIFSAGIRPRRKRAVTKS